VSGKDRTCIAREVQPQLRNDYAPGCARGGYATKCAREGTTTTGTAGVLKLSVPRAQGGLEFLGSPMSGWN
jgi:hypothetical protein